MSHEATNPRPHAPRSSRLLRTRWAAIGAAVAVSVGAGGIGLVNAAVDSGERSIFQAIEPCRLADTRGAPFTVGNRSTPLGANETMTLNGWGAVGECNLPNDTTALALNVTATDATAPTFVQVMPTGGEAGASSNLNPVPGAPATPNAVTTQLAAGGSFSVYNLAGTVNVIIDVVGVFADHTHDDRYYTQDEADATFYSQAEVEALLPKVAIGEVGGAIPNGANLPIGAPRVITTPVAGIAEVEVAVNVVAPSGQTVCTLTVNGDATPASPVVAGPVAFHEYVTVSSDTDAITSVLTCVYVGAANPVHISVVTGWHDVTYHPTV